MEGTKKVKELRRFLGMPGYYCKFIKSYGVISKTLTDLLKKGAPYVWNSEKEAAFQALKLALSTNPVLALPDFDQTFVLETDACSKGIGAVLLQNVHPIAFLSKALGPKLQCLPTYEKECLAILMAVEKWRPYLQHAEFIIRTDQKSLIHLEDKRLSTPWQHKALTKMLGLTYKIVYNKGVDNRVADALSRQPHDETVEVLAMSQCKTDWLEDMEKGYSQDPIASGKIAKLVLHSPQGN